MATAAGSLRTLPLLGAALLGAVSGASAETRQSARDRFLVTVEVVDSRPVHAPAIVSRTRLECRDRGFHGPRVDVYGARFGDHDGLSRDGRRAASAVGGLVGGAVGHRLARDGSRTARAGATVAGALLGSAAGRGLADLDRGRWADRPHGRAPERCVRVVETRRVTRLDHYEVTYTLRGRTLRTRRDRAPGTTIEIDVSRPPARR